MKSKHIFKISFFYLALNILSTFLFKVICLTVMVFEKPEMYLKSFQLDLSAHDDIFMILAYAFWLISLTLVICDEGYKDYYSEKKLKLSTFALLFVLTAIVLFFTSMQSGFTELNGGFIYLLFYPFGCLDFLTNDFFISSIITSTFSFLILCGAYCMGKFFVIRNYPDYAKLYRNDQDT